MSALTDARARRGASWLTAGMRLGMLTLSTTEVRKGQRYWTCTCDCGVETTARATHIASGATRSCGCARSAPDGDLTADRVRQLFAYDAETGVLTRRVRMGGYMPGTAAGSVTPNGYREIGIDGHSYFEHRVIWLLVYGRWPACLIDHRDGNPLNNALRNLREASHGQNAVNKRVNMSSGSGIKGVYRYRSRWAAHFAGKHLGYFSSAEDAASAYNQAAVGRYGDFVRLSDPSAGGAL